MSSVSSHRRTLLILQQPRLHMHCLRTLVAAGSALADLRLHRVQLLLRLGRGEARPQPPSILAASQAAQLLRNSGATDQCGACAS